MRAWALAGLALLLSAAFMAAVQLSAWHPTIGLVISDGGQLAAAVTASVACARAARNSMGRQRLGWHLLAVATGAWAAGQLVWSYYEVVLGRAVPFPSAADIGFVIFPVSATAGLVVWLGTENRMVARGRDLLDGAIIGGSLLVLSWVTTLGSVVEQGGQGWTSVTLSLAYPVGDVLLGTLVLLAVARGVGGQRAALVLLAVGLGGLAVADSAYVYLVGTGGYTSADLVSGGWPAGFLFVAAGALTVQRGSGASEPAEEPAGPDAEIALSASPLRMALPYIPLLAAGLATCLSLLSAPATPAVDLGLGVALVTLVLIRQFLAMRDNHRLLVELQAVRDELQQLALHDPLTGLANRALFGDRLGHALAQPAANVSVLFCDLDDFKQVNDALGHEAGDDLLRIVARRLLHCVRPADTVARLGGDEFAILLEHTPDVTEVADRVVDAIQQPYQIGGVHVAASVSIGIAHYVAQARHDGRVTAQEVADLLLRSADGAMYAAKASGKGRSVLAEEGERRCAAPL